MSQSKTLEQKIKTGSHNVPKEGQSVADQLAFAPSAGLPPPPAILENEPEATEIYYNLGNALMAYDSLYQGIDAYTLSMAALNYKRFQFCSEIANDPAQCFVEEAKSHTSMGNTTLKEHPAVKMMRDAQSDFMMCMKSLGLDLKGRMTILTQMSMISAIHGNKATAHPASKYFVMEVS